MDNLGWKWMKWMEKGEDNSSAVQKQVATMTKKGYISKEGTPKQWQVNIFSTIK
jgi:hypothetical protein